MLLMRLVLRCWMTMMTPAACWQMSPKRLSAPSDLHVGTLNCNLHVAMVSPPIAMQRVETQGWTNLHERSPRTWTWPYG